MRSDKDVFIITVFTFITVITWIFVDLVKATNTPADTDVPQSLLAPLPEKIDITVLDEIEGRTIYE